MKTLNSEAVTHFMRECTTTALCWIIQLRDGAVIRGTDHDRDIEIDITSSPPNDELEFGGTYFARANISGSNMRSAADMSVDNMDVHGAVGPPGGVDLTVAQLESGVADKAPVTIFLVNWAAPNDFQIELRRGYLGETYRDSDGVIKTEVRGMTQPLSQNIGQTYSVDCNVKRFGDARCKYPVETITRTAEVDTVTNRRIFSVVATPAGAPSWPTQFYNGEVHFTGGLNSGFSREIKTADWVAGVFHVELWDPLPNTPVTGDTLDFIPGCDRTKSNCLLYNNVINMHAYGIFIPGMAALMKGPI